MMGSMSDSRTEELRRALDATWERIGSACAAQERDPSSITLVVVTKTWPTDDAVRLVDLGVHDLGENRDQEASAKATAVRQARPSGDVRWHFIGQLQTNKAVSVASYADLVHTVDRGSLVAALDKGARKAGRRLDCLVEVNLDVGEIPAGRGGVRPEEAPAIADAIAAAEGLRLRGVMGVAPLGGDAEAAFARLADVREHLRRDHPDADLMSAGMSEDLEYAVAAGATHLRVGSAILGTRGPLG